ncbi:MAG: hypothetical protein ABFS86_13960 [Planctomycetota bacterium]
MLWMMSCREAAEAMTEAQLSPLPFRRRIALKMHLLMCRLCRRAVRQSKAIGVVVRSLAATTGTEDGDPAALGDLSPEARERMKEAIRDET